MKDPTFRTLSDFIGNTPLVELRRLPGDTSNTVLVKLEGNNPAGSVKDRPALWMIEKAERFVAQGFSAIKMQVAHVFTYDEDVVKLIAERCTELESGGRMIDAILTNTVLPKISGEFLTRMMEGKPIERVHVSVEGGEFSYGFD